MKKAIGIGLLAVLLLTVTTLGWSGSGGNDLSKGITVVSREAGSGTRGAFVELLGIEQDGVDLTTLEATISNSTSVVMMSVAGDEAAIGYISLGSLNDTVKAVSIDGAAATIENVKKGSYKIARPFNIATKGETSELAKDFIDFIMSKEGQEVVEASGYISVAGEEPYQGTKPSGRIVVGGSSSVTPVMEKLREAYLELNPNAAIEIQLSDSTTGMTSTINGIIDIGMASRALKEAELAQLDATVMAMDGIAVIVNNDNPVEGLTSQQVRDIYLGEIIDWKEILD
ncbi:MAG: phosphate ABC transporter substrate-binding protein [Firmicutes bacterium]|nr:phosphate ABC transporter substrate-binding protein [Bacillota bacterium]